MMASTTDSSLRSSNLFSVEGLVAVITGGGSGLGLMMATALAENGASKVYIIGRREEKLVAAAAAYPNIITPLPGDITSKDSLGSMAGIVRFQVGHIDLLVANAGIAGPGLPRGVNPSRPPAAAEFARLAWEEDDDTQMTMSMMDEFDAVYRVNCAGTYFTILAFLGLLEEGNNKRKQLRHSNTTPTTATGEQEQQQQHRQQTSSFGSGSGSSQVVAVSSMVAFQRDPRYGFAYLSSKAAVVSMMKSFATMGVGWGIRFNTIAPGLMFPSELSAAALNPFKLHRDKELTEEGTFSRGFLPAERAGSASDMAGVLLYLASRAGSYVNGSVMLVDGGKLATVPGTY